MKATSNHFFSDDDRGLSTYIQPVVESESNVKASSVSDDDDDGRTTTEVDVTCIQQGKPKAPYQCRTQNFLMTTVVGTLDVHVFSRGI